MSRLRPGKKLQPAKKAWRSFSNTVQSKVHHLNIPKVIRTTIRRLVSTFHSLRLLIPTKRRRSLIAKPYYYSTSYNYHVPHKNFSAVRIDDLFSESGASRSVLASKNKSQAQGETSRGKEVDVGGGESSGLNTIEDAWKMVVAKSPQLHVDERAEEFIYKFREDMKLQKERSMLEFQERLARGA